MLTKEDVKLLTEVFATREEIALKSDFEDLKGDLRTLQTSVDNLAKMVKDYRDEHIIIHRRLEVLEQWAKQVAAKLGISLPF